VGKAVKVLTGIEVIKKNNFKLLSGAEVGLLVNPASVDKFLNHTADIFKESKKISLCALFGPQHGIYGTTQDNMIEWEGFFDGRLGVKVYSLYGKYRKPQPFMLDGLQAFVIDLQDVGARYYTFLWTSILCIEACAQYGVKIFVLDRPNPIGGILIEGTVLKENYKSFVGLHSIPMRYGMTMGEVIKLICSEVNHFKADLTIVSMKGYTRSLYFDETDLPWVMPSPNMPTLNTAIVYPGFCLLEGTNISEGRGTTRPFEIFGAPFIDPYKLVGELKVYNLPGVFFRPIYFEPTFNKYSGKLCGGAQVHILDRYLFKPVLTAVAVIKTIYKLYPEYFKWKDPPYEYEMVKLPFDILAGNGKLRKQIEEDLPLAEIEESWEEELLLFKKRSLPYLMYE